MPTSCLSVPNSSSSVYTLSAASQLPTTGAFSPARRDAFVERDGTRLTLEGEPFKVVGPNVYWLGLDENVDPSPSYPTKGRVLEAMAIASVMGATTVRSQTLGISYGTALSVENALNTFKANDSAAWDAIDFAVFAARRYNLRLVLPLTDQYDYYHGAVATFLRWRNLSDSDYSPFYDTGSEVYADFERYVRELLGHVSPYTNLTLATDPTVLAFETGNELGGWTGSHFAPPVEWTTSVARLLKELAPNTLVIDGTYGVKKKALGIEDVDVYSDHFYPLYTSRLSSAASLAHSSNKAFLAGEYDWTNNMYARLRWAWWAMAIPVVLAALLWVTPGRWWPVRLTAREVASCGCCCRARRRRRWRGTPQGKEAGPAAPPNEEEYTHLPVASPSFSSAAADADKTPFSSSSSSALPILSPSASSTSFPPTSSRGHPSRSASWLDYPLVLRRWHVSLAILVVLLPVLGALLHVFLPSSTSSFLSQSRSLGASSASPKSTGDLYWSLFGRDDTCCAYVQHSDGYTLHYPSSPAAAGGAEERGSGERVAELTRHAWGMREERPYWLQDAGKAVGDLKLLDLPVVACPQEGLTLASGSVVGG